MCTVHVLESSVAVLKGAASGPGSIVPPIALPSHVMITVTSCRAWGVEPQSPYHVPTSGCPSWASTAVANDTISQIASVTTELRNSEFGIWNLEFGMTRDFTNSEFQIPNSEFLMAQSSAGATP